MGFLVSSVGGPQAVFPDVRLRAWQMRDGVGGEAACAMWRCASYAMSMLMTVWRVGQALAGVGRRRQFTTVYSLGDVEPALRGP
eukprot:6496029-Prymnesium_polylepis.1